MNLRTLLESRPLRLKIGGLVALGLAAGVVLGSGDEDDADLLMHPAGSRSGDTRVALAADTAPTVRTAATDAAETPSRLALDRLRRAGPAASDVSDLFAGHSWAPPPPPPPPVVAAPPPPPVKVEPPAPTAPPLPFTYIGRMQEEGQPAVIYLERDTEVLTVKAGQAIGSDYRLQEIAQGRLEFLYVPLETRQTLRIGESQ